MGARICCALAVLLSVYGCSSSTVPPTPTPGQTPTPITITPVEQQLVNTAVFGVVEIGCSLVPAADRHTTLDTLARIEPFATANPQQALTMLETLATVPGVAWIWKGLHSIIDTIQGVTSSSWFQYVYGALPSAINGCRSGLGVPTAGVV